MKMYRVYRELKEFYHQDVKATSAEEAMRIAEENEGGWGEGYDADWRHIDMEDVEILEDEDEDEDDIEEII